MFLLSDIDECVIDIFRPLPVVIIRAFSILCLIESVYFKAFSVRFLDYCVLLLSHCIVFLTISFIFTFIFFLYFVMFYYRFCLRGE